MRTRNRNWPSEDEPLVEAFCEFLARQKLLKYQEVPSDEGRGDGGLKESAGAKREEWKDSFLDR